MIISKTPFRMSYVGGGTDIRAFYKDDPGVVIISLSVGEDTPEGLLAYAEENDYPWAHALDINKEAFEAYNGIKIPKVVIIDPSGDLVYEKSSNRIPLEEVEDTVSSAKTGLADTVNLQTGSIWLMAVGAGVLSFFSPCSFPLLPGYVSFYLMNKKETSGGLNEKTMRTALPAGLAASAGILTIFLGLLLPLLSAAMEERRGFQGFLLASRHESSRSRQLGSVKMENPNE